MHWIISRTSYFPSNLLNPKLWFQHFSEAIEKHFRTHIKLGSQKCKSARGLGGHNFEQGTSQYLIYQNILWEDKIRLSLEKIIWKYLLRVHFEQETSQCLIYQKIRSLCLSTLPNTIPSPSLLNLGSAISSRAVDKTNFTDGTIPHISRHRHHRRRCAIFKPVPFFCAENTKFWPILANF